MIECKECKQKTVVSQDLCIWCDTEVSLPPLLEEDQEFLRQCLFAVFDEKKANELFSSHHLRWLGREKVFLVFNLLSPGMKEEAVKVIKVVGFNIDDLNEAVALEVSWGENPEDQIRDAKASEGAHSYAEWDFSGKVNFLAKAKKVLEVTPGTEEEKKLAAQDIEREIKYFSECLRRLKEVHHEDSP